MITRLRASLRRHALLRVDPLCWTRVLERAPDILPADHAILVQWVAHDWPLIVRRYLPQETREIIPVAVPLPPRPPDLHRRGLVLQLRDEEVLDPFDALPLPAALPAAPPAWQPTMRSLMALGEDCGSAPVLYGSLLWQLLTGMTYLTERSDLDLCWPVDSALRARALILGLARIERVSPMRVDGELLLPDGGSVAWREYADASAGHDELLVKSLHGVITRPRESLFGQAA